MTTVEREHPKHLALGEKIRRARKRKAISQEDFAPLVGVTRRHLIRLEGGWHRPGDDLLRRIAEATDQPLAFFSVPQEVAPSGDTFRRRGGPASGDPAARQARDANDDDAQVNESVLREPPTPAPNCGGAGAGRLPENDEPDTAKPLVKARHRAQTGGV